MSDRAADAELASVPIAPSVEAWAAMSEAERAAAVAALPYDVQDHYLIQGEPHADVVTQADEMIRNHFGDGGAGGRQLFIGKSLMVHYPAEACFAPDLFVVFDPKPSPPRLSWVVSVEEKGLDFAMEVIFDGDRNKDLRRNVEWYARLGIPEYFVLDRKRMEIHGFRLIEGTRRYRRILPQYGKYESVVLGLNIALEGDHFRFFVGHAPLPTAFELRSALQLAVEAEAARAETEAARAETEAARADLAEARLRELEEQIATLRKQEPV